MWRIREAGPRAAAAAPGAPLEWEGWDDAAVAPEKLGAYLRDLRALLDEYHYQTAFYGHFGHGCIHMRVSFDLYTEDGIRKYGEFVDRAADLVVSYGGSLSGEHGDGQSRGALLPKMFGERADDRVPRVQVGLGSRQQDEPAQGHRRLPADGEPAARRRLRAAPAAHAFPFPDDGGSLAKATLRCVGLGECRKHDSGTMCPSYMVTLEEEHSTRGRAHMLFELLQGEVVRDGWKDEHVKRALDLCLSCKACKSECPTNVDIATYRAEFLSHYYEGRRRPLHAYAFGMVDRWLRARVARARGWPTCSRDAPGVSHAVRRALHLAPERQLPRLAPANLPAVGAPPRRPHVGKSVSTGAAPAGRRRIGHASCLWVDTFNNYFHPETSQAALSRAPGRRLRRRHSRRGDCAAAGRSTTSACSIGRSSICDRSWTRSASRSTRACRSSSSSRAARRCFATSCAICFRPTPARPGCAAQTFLLSEFLESRPPAYQPPRLDATVLLHGHCHHKAIMKMGDEESLLRKMGADVQSLDSGCCGMAGAFGFEADKYAVSQAVGERVLLPAVRQAAAETVIVSDGFSCREQIRQATGRHAMHLAEVLQMALTSR